jgi:transcriptional regulator with XRE-family HTH domain
MNFGERLQTARKARGLTQKELGLEMNYPYRSADVRIAQYENSLRVPQDETVKELADALKITWCVETPWWIHPALWREPAEKIRRFRDELCWLTENFSGIDALAEKIGERL